MEADEFSSLSEALSAHDELVLLDDAATVQTDSASSGVLAVEFGVFVV